MGQRCIDKYEIMPEPFRVGYLKAVIEKLDDNLFIVIKTHGFDGCFYVENFEMYECDDDPDNMIVFEIKQDNPYSRITLRGNKNGN